MLLIQGTLRGALRALHSMRVVLATLVLLAIAPAVASAATYTVNTKADTTTPGGCTTAHACSLRDAVAAADAHSGSTIILRPGLYKLNTTSPPPGQLDITVPTTIKGAGTRLTTVDGNNISRVFDIEGAGAALIEDLTITHGHTPAVGVTYIETDPGDGGGIFSQGRLNLARVAIVRNTSDFGGAGVMYGTVHNFPGGPPPGGTWTRVTITHNTVSGGAGNGQGGGFVAATTLSLTNSTIADNTVSNPGTNEGGGFVTTDGTATLLNDTVSGNVAAEPVPAPAGDFGGGISGDDLGGGVPFTSTLHTTNTIVANNTADGTEANCSFIGASSTSSHNIQGDSSCGFSDLASKTTTHVMLGLLKNNGGPLNTMLPSPTSPAVDAADSKACPPIDERGVVRPQGAGCDIGAVELAPPTATTGPATHVTASAATLTGSALNPAVVSGTATFEWGTTSSYGQTLTAGRVPVGSSSPTAQLGGLTPGTTYHYRLVVTNTDGTAVGQDRTFTTKRSPTPIRITVVQARPTHKGCMAIIYKPGHAPSSSLTSSNTCNHVELIVQARVPAHLNGYAQVTASGNFGGHQYNVSSRGKGPGGRAHRPYPQGKLIATLTIPAGAQPTSWKIEVKFPGNRSFKPGHTSTTRIVRTGTNGHSKPAQNRSGFTG